ncbi:hypothetical protein BGZ99_002185 [Dissophora globulifera]|uniref:ENTH domain-containing protein n=1 Tax=Dissophora globulifera TaxID=979702 RepID=A0A9P6RSR0_9FUNG|nr:hypothetical protein BGZ99_002185 [Dissophora globulifera]
MATTSTPIYAAKSTIRSLKNFSKGYTDMQAKVRTATSNDPWGPSGTQMNELARATFGQQEFLEIMEILDKRMNDKGKNWRHVFKALTVLDYLLHVGSENVVKYARENLYIVKTLKEFQYIDEEGKDQGSNVRQKAKDITALLSDEARLKEARRSRTAMRDRMSGRAPGDRYDASTPVYEGPGAGDDDRDLQRALEESRRMAREAQGDGSDDELKKALELSKKDEQDRLKNMEKYNQLGGNWDEGARCFLQSQPTGFNNPYLQFQQQQLLQQQLEQEQLQQQQLMQQQLLQQQFQQQQQQQMAFLNTMNNPYQQQLMPQMTGAPAIGSNNPFTTSNIQKVHANQPFPDSFRTNPLNNNNNNNNNNGFNSNGFGNGLNGNNNNNNNNMNNNSTLAELAFLQNSMSNPTPAVPAINQPAPAPVKAPNAHDEKYAHLAMALSNREDGMDTFGNIGQLRVPSHHTQSAPVALASQITGASNPFQRSNLGGMATSNTLIDVGGSSGNNNNNKNNPFQLSQGNSFNSSGFFNSNPTAMGGMNASGTSNGAYNSNTLF